MHITQEGLPVTKDLFTNLGTTTVSSGGTTAPSAGATESWTVASSSTFPAASSSAGPPSQFYVADPVLPSEIILVTNVSGTTWSVTRGADSTTPVAHTAGFTVRNVVPATWLQAIENRTIGGAVYDVKKFGAVGDNSHDDTSAIQAAITASGWPANTAVIHFPPGSYKLTSAISVDGGGASSTPDLVFLGYGASLRTTTTSITLVNVTNSIVSLTGVKFIGLSFLPNANPSTAVKLTNAEFCEFTSCRFGGSFATGVEIAGTSTYTKFIGCEFDNMSRGLLLSGTAHFTVVNACVFTEQLSGDPLNWIEVTGGVEQLQVTNCVFYGTGATLPVIRLTSANSAIINGCSFYYCDDTAIQTGGFGSADDNIIQGCSFHQIKKHAVHIYGGVRNKVCNNTFLTIGTLTADTYDAVSIEQRFGNGGGSRNTVMGNTGSNSANMRYLVNEVSSANYNIVVGNVGLTGGAFNITGANSVNANNITF